MTVAVVEYKNSQFVLDSDGMAAAHISKLASAQSQEYAELAGRYANDDTDTDVVGGSSGERGAKYWADDAETRGAAQVALAVTAKDDAVTAKEAAETAQGLAEDEADRAAIEADRSEAAVAVAVLATEAVLAGDREFASFALGVSGTSTDEIFYVIVDGYPQFYKNGTSADADDIYYYTGPQYAAKTPALLLATTRAFAEGDILNTADGYRYEVVTTGEHLTTAGGVKLVILPSDDGAYHTGAIGALSSNDSLVLNQLMTAAANGTIVFDYSATPYITGSLIFPSNITVIGTPGTKIQKLTGGIRVFHIASVTDVHIIGNGMEIDGNETGNSHTLFLSASDRVTVEDLLVTSAGTSGDDCIYVGGNPSGGLLCHDIVFHRVRAVGTATTRSGLVLVAVDGFHAYDCKFSNGGGSMENSNGMDIEPNNWQSRDKDGLSAVRNAWFTRCDFHGSREQGAALGGDNINLDKCRFYGNGKQGAATSSNPYVTDFAKYRTGDLLGVSAVSTADGWVTVTTGTAGVDKLVDDFGIDVGAVIGIFGTNSGASWPTGLTGRMVIAEIDSTQSKIRLAEDYIYNKKTSLSGGSYPTLDNDPETASLYIWVATRLGVNSNITMIDPEFYDNAQDGVANNAALSLAFSYNARIIRPKIIVNGVSSGHDGIAAAYSYGAIIDTPDISPDVVGVASAGIRFGQASRWSIFNPDIRNLGRSGISVAGLTGSLISGGWIKNCGSVIGPPVYVDKGNGGESNGLKVFNDDSHRSSTGNGFHVTSNVTNHSVDSVRAWGNSSDDAFRIQGSGNIVSKCYENDVRQAELETATATNIASSAATVNTIGKYTGKIIKDTTNIRLMVALGSAPTSRWDVADGSASVTPS